MTANATSLNLAWVLEHHVRLHPDREAVVTGARRFTYAQVNALACQVANALRSLGLQRGEHVALTSPNLPYFPIVYYGILKAGCVVVPLNVLFKPREIAYHLQDSDAKAYFCFEGTPELPMSLWAREALDSVQGCKHFIVMPADPASADVPAGARAFSVLLNGQAPSFEAVATSPDDTAVILYTSGTTGQPKGAELSHLNLYANAAAINDIGRTFYDPSPGARHVALITLPLFHSFGQVTQMCAGFAAGNTLVLMPRFDAAAVVETMLRERVTFWSGVPTMYWTLAEYVKAQNVNVSGIREHLRLCTSGGAAMPVELMKRFESLFQVRILEGYGLSETSPVATFNHVDRPSKPGTVGTPIMGVQVAVVDEHDRPVPAGESGEVVIRGHNVMKRYYKRPDATVQALRNGWFHTGDIGSLDEDGYLRIVDRMKDMIIRGGFNVYPREVEEVLMTHPEVSLCAVVGVPDERLGEEVKAYIVRSAGAAVTEAGLGAWCRERFAAYKAPRLIEFRDALPMTATGKVLKRALRDV